MVSKVSFFFSCNSPVKKKRGFIVEAPGCGVSMEAIRARMTGGKATRHIPSNCFALLSFSFRLEKYPFLSWSSIFASLHELEEHMALTRGRMNRRKADFKFHYKYLEDDIL